MNGLHKTLILAFVLLGTINSLIAQDRQEYIDQYSVIAIAEMRRAGIPASIKLAQGILESNAGASMLAVKANNHFGIKCGGEWRGKAMHKKDDDRNRDGRLVKSCFRWFDSAEQSFIAHSEFLMDPAKDHRYGFLFDLDVTDYKSWAHGLKKAGYATNPRYPQLLISIIENYGLHRYDTEAMLVASDNKIKNPVSPLMRDAVESIRAYPPEYVNGCENGTRV